MADQGAGLVGLAESGPGQGLLDGAGGGHDEAGEDAADLSQGWPNQPACREVARELFLSPGTVRNYLATVTHKLGADTRSEAYRIAHENGWV